MPITIISPTPIIMTMLKSACETDPFSLLRHSILNRHSQNLVEDCRMMQGQSEVLEEIREKLERKNYASLYGSSTNNSFASLPVCTLSEDCFRNRFSEEFESSILDSALREVKSNCSEEVYETLAGFVSRHREDEDLRKEIERKGREVEQLSASLIIKQRDNCFLQREMFVLRQREGEVEEEKRRVRRRGEGLDQKEKRLHGVEMSLIFKEKLTQEVKRRFERQRDSNQATEQQLLKVYNQLNSIWSRIIDASAGGALECSSKCWRQEIMRRCKEQLVEQRRILQEQSLQIEQQYETMQSLCEQIKKVLVGGRKGEEASLQR